MRFLAIGFDPTSTAQDVPHVAYSVRPLLRTLLAGKHEYWDAVDNSCSVQVRSEGVYLVEMLGLWLVGATSAQQQPDKIRPAAS